MVKLFKFEKAMIFRRFKAFSTFSSYGDVSIICKSNLGQPPLTIVLHNDFLFSPNKVKLSIIFPTTLSSSVIFLNKAVFVVVIFSGMFSWVSDKIFPSSEIINLKFLLKKCNNKLILSLSLDLDKNKNSISKAFTYFL